jgi:predicted nucleic acid-binding protein
VSGTARAVVIDTNILGASLRPGHTDLWDQAQSVIGGAPILISYVTAAELRFGAQLAGWGQRRLHDLDQRLDTIQIVWPGPSLVSIYAELRTWATRQGHPIAAKPHEADRWVAATAIRLNIPLISADNIFDNVDTLDFRRVTSLRRAE